MFVLSFGQLWVTFAYSPIFNNDVLHSWFKKTMSLEK